MFTDKLKKIRKDKKLTQTQLAELCGISRNSIVNWETGKSTPKVGDIEKLSAILGISPQELINISTGTQDNVAPEKVSSQPKGFAYWGGVVDEARKVAERGDELEIHSIEPLLHLALETLSAGMNSIRKRKGNKSTSGVSAYNGDHSSYTGNSLTVGALA